jgi:hypothetical protein
MHARLLTALLLLSAAVPAAAAPKTAAAQAATGSPAKAADVQGTWVFDLEASLAHVQETMHLPTSSLGTMRTALEANKGTTYVFSGSSIEVKGSQAGDSKGTFRIEGADLVIVDRGEHRMQIGMKGKDLVLSMFGVGSIFKKR